MLVTWRRLDHWRWLTKRWVEVCQTGLQDLQDEFCQSCNPVKSCLRINYEICEDGFSGCGDLRVDCARAAVLSGTKDRRGYAAADHAPRIFLRLRLRRSRVAGSFPDPLERSDQVPAHDDPSHARKDRFSDCGRASLSPGSRGAADLHTRLT